MMKWWKNIARMNERRREETRREQWLNLLPTSEFFLAAFFHISLSFLRFYFPPSCLYFRIFHIQLSSKFPLMFCRFSSMRISSSLFFGGNSARLYYLGCGNIRLLTWWRKIATIWNANIRQSHNNIDFEAFWIIIVGIVSQHNVRFLAAKNCHTTHHADFVPICRIEIIIIEA